jgi:hypothetical protein
VPKRGEVEKFIFDYEILTDEITIVFDKMRDNYYSSNYSTSNTDISLQCIQFLGVKPQSIPDTTELEAAVDKLK